MLTDAEIKLIDALRSGNYKQTENRLRDEHGFCCLGVACDILDPLLWTKSERFGWFHGGEGEVLPIDIRDNLGWKHKTGLTCIIDRDGTKISLSYLNDIGFTFSQIADLIAANLVLKGESDDTRFC